MTSPFRNGMNSDSFTYSQPGLGGGLRQFGGARPPESQIHLAARQHALNACSSWLLAWEQSIEYDQRQAKFCLERALLSAHAAELSSEEAEKFLGETQCGAFGGNAVASRERSAVQRVPAQNYPLAARGGRDNLNNGRVGE